MKPTLWFTLACAAAGTAVAFVELGVKAYIADSAWKLAAEDVARAKVDVGEEKR